jgi:hypothetical protein
MRAFGTFCFYSTYMEKSAELVGFFEKMLARQEFLIPLVAASFQYPIHYYGMTSAALLEDLFVDAAINFKNNYHPEIDISRPDRRVGDEIGNSKGIKGWDYQFQGEHFSHKVGKSISDIALLWDATVKLPEDKRWSYDSTMVFVLSHYKKSKANLLCGDGGSVQITSLLSHRVKTLNAGQRIVLGERLTPLSWKVIDVIPVVTPDSSVQQVLPINVIWAKMVSLWSKSSANNFDIFVTTSTSGEELEGLIGGEVLIDFEVHPGIYVFQKNKLQNIQVKQNNRAVLLPALRVAELAKESAEEGSFVFLPSWYMAYAENRPADLYLAQKQEFENLSSASRRR